MTDNNEEDDDDVISLNDAGNVHIASRSLGLLYRGAITGRPVDTDNLTIHLHEPEEDDEDANDVRGLVLIRPSDIDEAAASLREIEANPAYADSVTDVGIAAPFRDADCAACQEPVTGRALCLTRAVGEERGRLRSTEQLIDAMRDDEDADFQFQDMRRSVWCHLECANDLAQILESAWDHTDDLLSDVI